MAPALGRSLVAAALLTACATQPSDASSAGARYLSDGAYRRSELVASIVNPSNGYSEERLAHYAGGDQAWDALPEWNPRVDPVLPSDLDDGSAARTTLTPAAEALDTSASVDDERAMVALGERAFFRYPLQLTSYAGPALASRSVAASYGIWIDDGRNQAGGYVRAELADGLVGLANTCAACHARQTAAGLLVGDGTDSLDEGRMLADAQGILPGSGSPLLTWGPGRVDVTTSDATAPERITDLRPVPWLSYLHQEATLRRLDRTSLAIRIETLVITSHSSVRPPRLIAWALAAYIESLAATLPAVPDSMPGAAIFAAQCSGCHTPPTFTGQPVALDVIGTDPTIGESANRGTGAYRVPSLRGVGTRGLLLHDASLASLDALFDPARTSPTYTGGTRPGGVPGHVFGLDLSDRDRTALLQYLASL